MKRIYVAGALNDDAVGYIKNLHRLVKYSILLRRNGYAVYVPGLDFLMGFLDGNFKYHDYFYNSRSWIKVSDAVFVVPKSKKSRGVKREVKAKIDAAKRNASVVYSLRLFLTYSDNSFLREYLCFLVALNAVINIDLTLIFFPSFVTTSSIESILDVLLLTNLTKWVLEIL